MSWISTAQAATIDVSLCAVQGWTLTGVYAGYRNVTWYRQVGNERNAKKWYYIGVISTVATVVNAYFLVNRGMQAPENYGSF